MPSVNQKPLTLRVLGSLTLSRGEAPTTLPPSKKTRALLAYLALSPQPLRRERLCEIFWEGADDPRSSLRWSLNRLRGLVDDAACRRLQADRENVRLDLSAMTVDAPSIEAVVANLPALDDGQLAELIGQFRGEFLEGLELPACPQYQAWLIERRHAFRAMHLRVLDAMAAHSPADKRIALARERRTLASPTTPPLPRAAASARTILTAGNSVLDDIASAASQSGDSQTLCLPDKPSIAVLPFTSVSGPEDPGGMADGIAADIITLLARVDRLFVIARGSSFRYRRADIDLRTVGHELGVRYVLTGSLVQRAQRVRVTVDLCEAESRKSLWSERYDRSAEKLFEIEDEIIDAILGMLEGGVDTAERQRTLAAPPRLDAWGAYHRGAWHSLRYTRADNDLAGGYFDTAIRLDRGLARAYAGKSSTCFRRSFIHWAGEDCEQTREAALRTARDGLAIDSRDAFVQTAMGRALWLNGMREAADDNLSAAVALSPSYAFGHYAIGIVNALGGDPKRAVSALDRAQRLSPFDPLRFGMDAGRTLLKLGCGDYEAAAIWAMRAARQPNAHAHILTLAAMTLSIAGIADGAAAFAREVRRLDPQYRCRDFFVAFDTLPEHVVTLLRHAGAAVGIPDH